MATAPSFGSAIVAGLTGIHASQVREFGNVVGAVAVHVRRVGDLVLLHPVALSRQGRQVLRQRGRARFTADHRYRHLHLCAIRIECHVEHEVVRSG